MFQYLIRCRLEPPEFVAARDFLRYLHVGEAVWADGTLTVQADVPAMTDWEPLRRYLESVHGACQMETTLISGDAAGTRP